MELEVVALDHLYVSVRDLDASEAFYDPVMHCLGFRKGTSPIAGEPHRHYFNRVLAYTLRPARSGGDHDPYAPGLHHVCFRLADRAAVDRAARELDRLGVEVTPPQVYPEYAPDYYASFFSDPDGIRLELVAETRLRRRVRERFAELTEWEDPVSKAGLLEG
jgi:catechol 2,3-dioxygenase-like lactoylglutathione lyase family enzyme